MVADTAVYGGGRRLQVDVKPDDLEGMRKAVQSADGGEFVSVGLDEPDEAEMARVWAGIAALISVFAGIYGMNFANMPELKWSLGYPAAIFLVIGFSVLLYRRFKKSGWL